MDWASAQPAGAAVISGQAPLATVVISIGSGSLTVTGLAPSFVAGQFMAPDQATLTIGGLAPLAIVPQSIAVPVGSAVINGLAPTFDLGISPSAGTVTAAGLAPTFVVTFDVGVGALTLDGLVPSISVSGAAGTGGGGPGLLVALALNLMPLKQPGAASLALAGLVPSWGATYSFEVPQAALTVTGRVPNPQDSAGSLAPVMQDPPNLVFEGQIPQIYIGVQVRFPFDTTQGFVPTPGPGTSMALSADGNPGPSLASLTTGSSRNSTNIWTLATDWAALGIPADKVVTAISLASCDSRVLQYTLGQPSDLGPVTLTPTGAAGIQIAPLRTFNAAEAGYTTSVGAGASGLEIPSGGSLSIVISNRLRTLGGAGTKTVNVRQDNVNFVVTYTSAKTLIPNPAALAITGHAPTVTSVAAEIVQPPAGSLAVAGAGPTLQIGTPVTGGGGGPGLLAGLALNLEGTPLGPVNLVITGYAPSISAPIVAQGYDELVAERATMSSTGGRIINLASPTIIPGVGSLSVSGLEPTPVATATNLIALPVTALTITVTLPTLGTDHVRVMGVGTVTSNGFGPSVEPSYTVSPLLGTLSIAGLQPVAFVSQVALPDAGGLTVSGLVPEVLLGALFKPDPAVLTITGYDNVPFGLKIWTGSGNLASGSATVSGSGIVKRFGSGILNAQPALSLVGTGSRRVTATGTLQAGPASLSGTILTVTSVLRAQDATILARGIVRGFDPSTRRLKPQRVNRYNVALKPSPRRRVKNPNRRRPKK